MKIFKEISFTGSKKVVKGHIDHIQSLVEKGDLEIYEASLENEGIINKQYTYNGLLHVPSDLVLSLLLFFLLQIP